MILRVGMSPRAAAAVAEEAWRTAVFSPGLTPDGSIRRHEGWGKREGDEEGKRETKKEGGGEEPVAMSHMSFVW